MITKNQIIDLEQKIITSTSESNSEIFFSKEEVELISEMTKYMMIRLSGCEECLSEKINGTSFPCNLCLRNPMSQDYYYRRIK